MCIDRRGGRNHRCLLSNTESRTLRRSGPREFGHVAYPNSPRCPPTTKLTRCAAVRHMLTAKELPPAYLRSSLFARRKRPSSQTEEMHCEPSRQTQGKF